MIRIEKLPGALHALQGVLVQARYMAYQEAPAKQIADILDSAEYLPWLIAKSGDETETFRDCLVAVAKRHQCESVVRRFDDPPPVGWEMSQPPQA